MSYQQEIVRLLTQAEVPEGRYFEFCFVGSPKAGLQLSVQTQWCGYSKDRPPREIREGRLFPGERRRQSLRQRGCPVLLINQEADVEHFYGFGGRALILRDIAERCFASYIAPSVCLRESTGLGFVDMESLQRQELQYAPGKALRMRVLTRDGRRCVICGRSPACSTDVELHVHHAVPWAQGGITEEANLITVCKTCHDGLDPHWDSGLVELVRKMYPGVSPLYFEELQEYPAFLKTNMTEGS